MNQPGFNAQRALYPSAGRYSAGAGPSALMPHVAPQSLMDWIKCGVGVAAGAAACAGTAGVGCWAGGAAASIACGEAVDKAIKGE
jgi:hypothetical protein